MKFYGPTCVEDADQAELEAYVSSGVSPDQQQRVLEQVQLWSMQPNLGPWHKADPLERRPPKPPPRCSPNAELKMGAHGARVTKLPGECTKPCVCVPVQGRSGSPQAATANAACAAERLQGRKLKKQTLYTFRDFNGIESGMLRLRDP